ncbi:MAG: molybdenum cofactor guanylyltransferase MobA [Bauldia sp.]
MNGQGRGGGTEAVGVLLAGGEGRRLGGGDKGLRPLAGRPLIEHVRRRLAPQVGAMVLSANGDPRRFAAFALPVVADAGAGSQGPLAGLLAGLRWARANAPGARFLASAACDTPFLPTDLVARLKAASGKQRVALAASRGTVHPVFGLWPVALADRLEGWLAGEEGRSVQAFARAVGYVEVAFADGPGGDPFFNVNTPEDLQAAETLAARA